MQLRRTFCLLSLVTKTLAKDGPVDWTKAPGGGPATLRACARYTFNGDSSSVNVAFGCDIISCVCRPDLIEKIQDNIKQHVLASCGKDADVDVQMALKMYNDYCSANDYPIPGYTYIVTQTAAPPSATATAAVPTETTGTTTSDLVPIPTGTGVVFVTVTAAAPVAPTGATTIGAATVTVVNPARATPLTSSSPPRLENSWLHFLCHLLLAPLSFVLALPDSIIVTYTPSALPAAVTLVVTTLVSKPPASVMKSTQIVAYVPQVDSTSTVGGTFSTDGSSSTGDGGSVSGRGTGQGPTTLEVVGIVIGIIGGLVTTVATVWMCARSHRRRGVVL